MEELAPYSGTVPLCIGSPLSAVDKARFRSFDSEVETAADELVPDPLAKPVLHHALSECKLVGSWLSEPAELSPLPIG